ncbi:hypothetical protein NPS49_04320 [Pseudomonas putida]|uniref:hypothetical protein n=1 Tax=Pseudomonas TaxID=286 RepID=UPI000863615D|nr:MULTISPECIES: hypothetical protein [Pseudomonas]MDD2067542.1 hypothetical protein [Pseudomonas putida]HDS1740216.1 hypothetical protein [Pseudomonas putida]
MRMTKNKARVLEALAHIDPTDNLYPPYNAVRLQEVLRDDLGYGDFDLANLTRTLKSLVSQGLVKCSVERVDMHGTNGCIHRWFEQKRLKYWPAVLDLDAMRVEYKITPQDYELKWHNFFQRRDGLPQHTMEEFWAYKAERAAAK